MPDSQAFEWVSAQLEQATTLSRIEARGTVRLALRAAGLDPASVAVREMAVVVQKVLPEQLRRSGVPDGEALCERIGRGLRTLEAPASGAEAETPEAIFRRLGGGA
jgi:hypothetical protein